MFVALCTLPAKATRHAAAITLTSQAAVFPERRPDRLNAHGAGPLDARAFPRSSGARRRRWSHHYESAVTHIQPVGPADELVVSVSNEGAVDILAEVWLVKLSHILIPPLADDGPGAIERRAPSVPNTSIACKNIT
jgi:hypothetical protein